MRTVNVDDIVVIDNLEWEIWREIDGFDGLYEISNYGRVKSLLNRYYPYCPRILKHVNSNGYKTVQLCKDKYCRPYGIHVLLAQAFIPNPFNLPEVNHLDGDKSNYALSNLEWASKSRNMQHAVDMGLKRIVKGSEHGGAKLKEYQVIEIINSSESKNELALKYGVCDKLISSIKRGKGWKHINTKEYIPLKRRILSEEEKKNIANSKGSLRMVAKQFNTHSSTVFLIRKSFLNKQQAI